MFDALNERYVCSRILILYLYFVLYCLKVQKVLSFNTIKSIKHHFYNLLKSSAFIGEFILNKKLRFKNDYEIPENLENLIKRKDKNYSLSKSILAFFTNNKKKIILEEIKENQSKFISLNFFNSGSSPK